MEYFPLFLACKQEDIVWALFDTTILFGKSATNPIKLRQTNKQNINYNTNTQIINYAKLQLYDTHNLTKGFVYKFHYQYKL